MPQEGFILVVPRWFTPERSHRLWHASLAHKRWVVRRMIAPSAKLPRARSRREVSLALYHIKRQLVCLRTENLVYMGTVEVPVFLLFYFEKDHAVQLDARFNARRFKWFVGKYRLLGWGSYLVVSGSRPKEGLCTRMLTAACLGQPTIYLRSRPRALPPHTWQG